MAATIKSRVLVREEKGMAGISMKRLVFCGMGAGMSYFVINLSPLHDLSIPALMVIFCLLVFLSGSRYGVARYQWILLNTQGRLLMHVHLKPASLIARSLDTLDLKMADILVDAQDLFDTEVYSDQGRDLGGIEILDSDALSAGGFQIFTEDGILLEAG